MDKIVYPSVWQVDSVLSYELMNLWVIAPKGATLINLSSTTDWQMAIKLSVVVWCSIFSFTPIQDKYRRCNYQSGRLGRRDYGAATEKMEPASKTEAHGRFLLECRIQTERSVVHGKTIYYADGHGPRVIQERLPRLGLVEDFRCNRPQEKPEIPDHILYQWTKHNSIRDRLRELALVEEVGCPQQLDFWVRRGATRTSRHTWPGLCSWGWKKSHSIDNSPYS